MNIKLLEGEKIEFNSSPNNQNNHQSKVSNSHEINEKYIQGKRRIVTEQARYPLESIISMIESGKYKLDPDFQRRRRWDDVRKSRLIESFIINIPVPPIFLYEESYASYEVMDGQQRMRTIYDFYKDEFKLTGLEEWNDLNGYTYSQLPDRIKAGIDRRYISSIILLKETSEDNEQEKELKKLVFERINSGGIRLTPQETRNALYDGKLNRLCVELSANQKFRKLWNIYFDSDGRLTEESDQEFYQQMDDVELVLRFFAFRQIDEIQGSLEETLDYFLIQGNSFDDSIINQYRKLFEETIEVVYQLFGEQAFWAFRKGRKGSKKENHYSWTEKPLKVMYDPIMQSVSQYLNKKQKLIENKSIIKKNIEGFYKEHNELFSGRKTSPKDVKERIDKMLSFLSQIDS